MGSQAIIDELRCDGIAVLAEPMEVRKVDDFLHYLESKPRFDGQVHERNSGPWQPGMPRSCWRMDDVIRAPHWFEEALKWTPLAGEYLGQEPVLYSLNAFTFWPGFEDANIMKWHTDKDDVKMLVLFMFCTEGEHKYMMNKLDLLTNKKVQLTLCVRGQPGMMFLEDPSGLHRGIKSSKQRTLAWARWGVSDPPESYAAQKPVTCSAKDLGERYPADPWLQRAIRLVVTP